MFVDPAVLSVLSLRDAYEEFFYVGLSGGATVGLSTCSLLAGLLDACYLVAGVMPLTLRLTQENFGDAEQISGGFHRRQKTLGLVQEIARSETDLLLIFNSDDPCCFNGRSARLLREELETLGLSNILSIRNSFQHDFDPDFLLDAIANWRPHKNRPL